MEILGINVKEVSEMHYDDMLGCVPPHYIKVLNDKSVNGFAVGEAYSHEPCDGKWKPVFAAYLQFESKFYKVENAVHFTSTQVAKTSNIIIN